MVQASRRKFHILYKTTCLTTGRYYIGIHSTDEVEDGYLGSGVHLTRSVKKHGRLAHTREVLDLLPSRRLLKLREAEVVTSQLIKEDVLCMNLIPGGNSNDREFGITEKTRELLSIASKRFTRTKEHYEKVVATRTSNGSYQHTAETKAKIANSSKGRVQSAESRAKISAKNLGRVVEEDTRALIAAGIRKNKEAGLRKKPPPKTAEHRAKLAAAQTGKKATAEVRALMSAKAKNRPPPPGRKCTIDGVQIFESIAALVRTLGRGKNGLKNSNFRFITTEGAS